MEAIMKKQVALKKEFEILVRNFRKTSKTRYSAGYINVRLEMIDTIWQAYRANFLKAIEDFSTDEKFEAFEVAYSQIEDQVSDLRGELAELLRQFTPTNSRTTEPEQRGIQNGERRASSMLNDFKLPPITIPHFNGTYGSWSSFKDLFVSLIHKNDHLSPVQKLHYLKSNISGDAEQMLRHLQMTDDNYDTAWNALNDRYENKRMLVDDQLSRLMAIPKGTKENTQSLQHLLDTTNECLASLKNLGMKTDDWDPLIVFITVRKLPSETYRIWESKYESTKEVLTYKQLKDFLEGRYQTLQRISVTAQPLTNSSHSSTSRTNPTNRAVKSFHRSIALECVVCQQQHTVRQCPNFLKLSGKKRRELTQAKGLCLNCLSRRHGTNECQSSSSCYICGSKHHTLIHSAFQENELNSSGSRTKSSPPKVIPVKDRTSSEEPRELHSHCATETLAMSTLLPTALVKIHAPNGETGLFRALIDQGSQASFISEAATCSLNLKRKHAAATINGLSQTQSIRARGAVSLIISSHKCQTSTIQTELLIIPTITTNLPSSKLLHSTSLVSELELADPTYWKPGKIDLLLGADVYPQIILEGMIREADSQLLAQKTIFGWIISGPTYARKDNEGITSLHTTNELEILLRKFWELEEICPERKWTKEEQACEDIYRTTTTRDEKTGRYTVKLPFKHPSGEACSLGRSREMAWKRLQHLEHKLARNQQLRSSYVACIQEYLDLGHMVETEAPKNKIGQTAEGKIACQYTYLPHHGVLKESSSTTKLRVVFDASAKTSTGVSLNEELLVGPTIQEELIQILSRWRTHKIALTADVEKMYRQIWVTPEHASYQKILWRFNESEDVKEYKLRTVTFGTSAAPFLAIRTLHQLAKDEADKYPLASTITMRDFYVDDLMTGAETVDEASQLRFQLTQLTKTGCLHLRKWMSNNPETLTGLAIEDRQGESSIELNPDDNVKALGILWQPSRDVFHFKINLSSPQGSINKRKVLSDVARLFDPLGWLAPVVISAKIMMQSLWQEGLSWDEELPTKLRNNWLQYREALPQLEDLRIPRWLKTTRSQSCELHGFSDASDDAYAAALYVRVSNGDGQVHVNLLIAKTRVSPIKRISTPRLELCGAVLLSRLVQKVQKVLNLDISAVHAWTDSTITLAWIRSSPNRWKCFVANRVTEIISTLTPEMWHHVKSQDNPADCASRGILPKDLPTHHLWWHGPEWLSKPSAEWQTTRAAFTTDEEARKRQSNPDDENRPEHLTSLVATHENTEFYIFERFSSLKRLIRVSAQIRRYMDNLRKVKPMRRDYKSHSLSASELRETLHKLLKISQWDTFKTEMHHLAKNLGIPDKSKLASLHPYLDPVGLMRVGGRLQNANLPPNETHPIILSAKHRLTMLLIAEAHQVTQHGGPQLMLAHLRHRYWIIDARNALRRHYHQCLKCFRQSAEASKQLMGQLPRPRVTPTRPFTHTGLDYAGPIDVRVSKGRGTKSYKGYISIFVCLCTKALHLEAVSDLTTEAFLAAFRRFSARRGLPNSLYSDCGTNFVGAEKQLRRELKQAQTDTNASNTLANDGIDWHFIPPASPHFGGLWEAGVKSTKHHLKRIVGNSNLTYEELTTVLCQIEAALNSRPLCPLTNDPSDLGALTPGHFLTGMAPLTPPEPQLLDLKLHSLTRWQLLQRMQQHFWSRWSGEYLGRLQQRPKWTKEHESLKVNDLVLIKDERTPPCKWPLGRIVEIHPGNDGLVTVKTATTTLKRPITKICVLPEAQNYSPE